MSSSSGISDTETGEAQKGFPNAIQSWGGRPLTLRERAMIAVMGRLTDKNDWQRKVMNEKIVTKLRKEVVSEERDFSETMFDFCLKELRETVEFSKANRFVPAISANAVLYKSDEVIEDELIEELKRSVAFLEDSPEAEKDWHPGSDDKVLDLVHPSLFPLIYNRTPVIDAGIVPRDDPVPFCGKGTTVPSPEAQSLPTTRKATSERFQWLPCDVAFAADETVEITSYINNLHPVAYHQLYETMERITARTIPLWNATLTQISKEEKPSDYPGGPRFTHGCYPARIQVRGAPEWTEGHLIVPEGEDPDTYESNWTETGYNWERSGLVKPEPTEEYYNEREALLEETAPIDLRNHYAETGLQVIVKLANIHLTPDKAEYNGGTWHVEGQVNEHVCASALLYYDNHNVTDSYLAFRERTNGEEMIWGLKDDFDRGYKQGDWEHMELLFGVENDGPALQNLGHVLTKEGRLLVWPNVLQHRVGAFRLADASKPGHRKILALFLVDPNQRIPSTANVPPQQKDLWKCFVGGLDRLGNLPPELLENVFDLAGDFPITVEEAKAQRLELMKERSEFVDRVNGEFSAYTYSFCEH